MKNQAKKYGLLFYNRNEFVRTDVALLNDRGSTSVYMILLFIAFLSLTLFLIEGARENAIKAKTECAMDLAMSSTFAEYNRELLKQYDLFFIDTSYGQSKASISNTQEHIKGYLDANFKTDKVGGLIKDVLAINAQEVKISEYSLASDEDGNVLKKQAVDYMKDRYGLTYIEDLQKQMEVIDTNQLLTRDIEGERLGYQSIIDNYEIPPKKVKDDEWEEVKLNNPADPVNASRGVLFAAFPKNAEISSVGINQENYISKRKCNVGCGLKDRKRPGGADELIFNEYILEKSGNFVSKKENSELQYQTEYVLFGKDSDPENIKSMVRRLLLLRETANVVYLYSDSVKCGEVDALATIVTALVEVPELKDPVKHTILFAWAYAESVYDVRTLLSGGKIPLIKTSDTWHYSLSGMFSFASSDEEDANQSEGMSYKDYLRVFLALDYGKSKTLRFMDIIEMDIRRTQGNMNFRLDCCVDYLEAEAFTSSGYGFNHSIKRSFYYEK